MRTPYVPPHAVSVAGVRFDGESLHVTLSTGAASVVPLTVVPALRNAPITERGYYRLVDQGQAIYWPLINMKLQMAAILEHEQKQTAQS